MLFGQHFDGESPRNLNHVFLRPFENGSNTPNKKKIGMFMFKNQNDGATLLNVCGLVRKAEAMDGLQWGGGGGGGVG